jgi:hypothetical protein
VTTDAADGLREADPADLDDEAEETPNALVRRVIAASIRRGWSDSQRERRETVWRRPARWMPPVCKVAECGDGGDE